VVGYGDTIYWLSDSGVYGASFVEGYDLRGLEMPLSEAIQPWIDRINKEYMDNSVGVYHDNRYYLFVPMDDSTQNDYVLVYNIINGGWESVDSVNSQGWDVLEAIPAQSQKANELYCVTVDGGIHKFTNTSRSTDKIAFAAGATATETVEIAGTWTSRQYDLDTMERKRWQRYSIHAKSDDSYASTGNLSAIVEDPDATVGLGSIEDVLGSTLNSGESADLRGRIGNKRGYGIQLSFASSSGRPAIRAAQVKGAKSYSSTTSTK
jgi:hypothetical protein